MNKQKLGNIAQLWTMSLPIIIAQACESLLMLTDRVLVRSLHPLAPAAALAGGMTAFTLWVLPMGVLAYLTPLVARRVGANDQRLAEQLVSVGVLAGLAAGLLIVWGGPPLGAHYFRWLGLDGPVAHLALDYLSVLVLASPVMLVKAALAETFAGLGRTRCILVITVVGAVVNIPLTALAVGGFLGQQLASMQGAAAATVLAEVVMLVAFVLWFGCSTQCGYRIKLPKFAHWRELLAGGLPIGAEFLVLTLALHTFLTIFQSQGASAAQAVTVASSWAFLLALPFYGVHVGVSSLVGRAIGAGDAGAVLRTTRSGLLICFIVVAIASLLFWGMPHHLAAMFVSTSATTETSGHDLAIRLLGWLPLYCLCDAISFPVAGTLRASGFTRYCFAVSLLCQWTFVLGLWHFAARDSLDPASLWIGFILVLAVQATLQVVKLLRMEPERIAASSSRARTEQETTSAGV